MRSEVMALVGFVLLKKIVGRTQARQLRHSNWCSPEKQRSELRSTRGDVARVQRRGF